MSRATVTTIELQLQLQRNDFDMQIDTALPGRGITAISGPSGCGKTTLLRAIAGLEDTSIKRELTHISVNGRVWHSHQGHIPTSARRVGYVFQEANLFAHLSVKDNLEFGLKRNQPAQVNYDEVIEIFDLAPLLARATENLSGGERQRVALARALLASPSLLLMDEPLAALDHARKQEILPYLERLQTYLSIPMIYVSHALDEIVQLADYLLLMERGRITAQGTVIELFNQPSSPLAHREDAFSLLSGQVLESCSKHQLTRVAAGDTCLYLPRINVSEGEPVSLRVYSRDISLCLDYPRHTSILNIIPAHILALEVVPDKGQCLVHLALADQQVLARISLHSQVQLDLKPDQQVFAQIKALSLMK